MTTTCILIQKCRKNYNDKIKPKWTGLLFTTTSTKVDSSCLSELLWSFRIDSTLRFQSMSETNYIRVTGSRSCELGVSTIHPTLTCLCKILTHIAQWVQFSRIFGMSCSCLSGCIFILALHKVAKKACR